MDYSYTTGEAIDSTAFHAPFLKQRYWVDQLDQWLAACDFSNKFLMPVVSVEIVSEEKVERWKTIRALISSFSLTNIKESHLQCKPSTPYHSEWNYVNTE